MQLLVLGTINLAQFLAKVDFISGLPYDIVQLSREFKSDALIAKYYETFKRFVNVYMLCIFISNHCQSIMRSSLILSQ